MLEKMIFGRFVPGDSFVHRLDPRSKLSFVILFVIAVFMANNALTYGLLLAFALFVIFVSRIRLYFIINGLKPILFLIIFTFLMHLFLNKEGALLIDWKVIKIYEEGVRQGFFISIRFLVLVLITSILTLTTSPISITDGMEDLLGPFKRFKLPVHELALMMSISLRFIPTLMDETDKILRAVVPLLVPLFVSAFKRAEELAIAMEVRGYRGGEGRTRYRQLSWGWRDTLAMALLAVLICALYLLRG